jgi:hypothetical protein
MNKRMPGISVLALGLLVGAGAVARAQEPAHTETEVKHTGAGPNTKSKTESVTGTVKEYEAGKRIKMTGPGDKTYTFDLDENARVEGSIAVGQAAKVTFTKSSDGVERVTVISEGSGAHGATGAMGSSAAAAGERMKVETETKHTGVGPNTKTKTETVVGTVKKFEAGKSIEVTGPGDKNYSFDLDDSAGVKGNVAVGDRVKVTYTKTDSGDKVTTVQPYK